MDIVARVGEHDNARHAQTSTLTAQRKYVFLVLIDESLGKVHARSSWLLGA